MNEVISQQTIQPMTINMIKKGLKQLQLDYVVSEGHTINNILIVGFSVELLIDNDKKEFTALIEDSTGNIEIATPFHQSFPNWLDILVKDNPKKPGYVRCIVQPMQFKQEIVFKCLFMELVKDHNVITLHLLDCIKAYQYRKSIPVLIDHDSFEQIKQRSIEFHSNEIFQSLPMTKQEILNTFNIPEELLNQCLIALSDKIILDENQIYHK